MKLMLVLNTVEFEMAVSKIVLSIYEFIYGASVLDEETILCQINVFEFQSMKQVELTIVAVLSLMRYFIVCHKVEKSLTLWMVLTIIMCAPACFVYTYPAIIKDAAPSPSKLLCYPYTKPDNLTKIMNCVIPFLFIIPSWIITYCYFAIGLKVNKQLNKMKAEPQYSKDPSGLAAIKCQKIKISIQLTTVIVIYNINFSIAYLTWFLKAAIRYSRPPILEALSGILTFLTFTINPLLTITFQPELNLKLATILFYINLKVKKLLRSLI